MKTFTHLLAVLTLAALLLAVSNSFSRAQGVWGNVEVFQLPDHHWNLSKSLVADQAGRLFVAGYSYDRDLPYTFLVRRSMDGGANWETVLTFDMPPSSNPATKCQITVDLAGQIYLVHGNGNLAWQGGSDASHWIVRKSVDHGDTWNIVDDYSLEIGFPSTPTAITSDAAGTIYVSGYAWTSTLTSGKPVLRRSTDGGQSWTTLDGAGYGGAVALVATQRGLFAVGMDDSGVWSVWRSTNTGAAWELVDNHQYQAAQSSYASGLTSDHSGNLYAVGWGWDASDISHWIVRRSTDGGSTWATVDDYKSSADQGASASAVTTDDMGRVCVGGGTSDYRWMVRSSSDGGASWVTSDDFLLATNHHAGASAMASDKIGNVFVSGWSLLPGTSANPPSWFWVVRKLAFQPQLTGTPSSGELRLSWPINTINFVLQSATTLANGGDWQDVTNAPTETNGQKMVTITPIAPSGFFRLRGP